MSLKSAVKKLEKEIKPPVPELVYENLTPEERKKRIEELLEKARESHDPLSNAPLTEGQQIIDEYLIRHGREPIYSK